MLCSHGKLSALHLVQASCGDAAERSNSGEAPPSLPPAAPPHRTLATKCSVSIFMSTKTYMQGREVTSTGTRQE